MRKFKYLKVGTIFQFHFDANYNTDWHYKKLRGHKIQCVKTPEQCQSIGQIISLYGSSPTEVYKNYWLNVKCKVLPPE